MSPRHSLVRGACVTLASLSFACGPADRSDPETQYFPAISAPKPELPGADLQSTAAGLLWSRADDPVIFAEDLEYELERLPLAGEAATAPWPGGYWPTASDSINLRWDGSGSHSPAKKYELAFGGLDVEDAVSQYSGLDQSRFGATDCTSNSDCDSGEECGKREGHGEGVCTPTWWGICHAWAPAAILEPEPRYPVVHNGIEFAVNDIKALLTLAYNRTINRFISRRCNETEIEYDENGRPTDDDAECRDTNPGTFHVIATNYLGLRGESFIEDRVYDAEVWNQPVRSYEVTHLEEVTAAEANALVGVIDAPSTGSEETEQHTDIGTIESADWASVGAFPVAPGTTLVAEMTGTNDADLYVRFDAPPTTGDYDCRPYATGTNETCDLTVPLGANAAYVAVRGYAESSIYGVVVVLSAPQQAYVFNDAASRLFHVKMSLRYINESRSDEDGYLSARIDDYTRTDYYEYVLELDEQDRIAGGEWVGRSKTHHPDFLWLPERRHNSLIAGGAIDYDDVKALVELSQIPGSSGGDEIPDVVAVDSSGTLNVSAEVALGGSYRASVAVAAGDPITITTGAPGDVDLYVALGRLPTLGSYDQRSTGWTGDEEIVVNPDSGGTLHIMVHGYEASTFTLTAQ